MTVFAGSRRILLSSAIYGIADAAVLAVGGLILLPLYMRSLTQSQFGDYVVVKTNAELFTYVLFMGLPSAAARVYFDHRKRDRHSAYMGSLVNLFLLNVLLFAGLFWFCGDEIWRWLSPSTPARPYLWFSMAIASAGFFASMGPLWLRLENRIRAFVFLQLASSLVLAAVAVLALSVLNMKLTGIVVATLTSSVCSALVLPSLLGRTYRPRIEIGHISESLRFALPTVVTYVAYFVLNRIATVVLQRHVASDQIAVFGLAQQLATVVTVFSTAFGKAIQPAVYAAEPRAALELLDRSGKVMILSMFSLTSCLMMFSWEALSLFAPKSYTGSFEIFLALSWSNLAYSFNLISNTSLFYHRKPKISAALLIGAAILSASLSLWLVPEFHVRGAATATAVAFALSALGGQWMTKRLTGQWLMSEMILSLLGAAGVAVIAWFLRLADLPWPIALGVKVTLMTLIGIVAYLLYRHTGAQRLRT